MKQQQDNNISSHDHEEWVHLIPGYVKGKLTAAENAAVKQHLTNCDSCRQEASNCKALADSLPNPAESWQPSAAHFTNILAEVDELEAAKKGENSANTVAPSGFVQRIRQLFAQTPSPVCWTLAAESLAFVILAAVMVLPGGLKVNNGQTGVYETLSSAETPISSSGRMLRVVFSDDITAKEMSELLLQSKTQIRQGPSAVGAYTIEIATEAAVQAESILRAHPKVKLVLPVAVNALKP